VAGAAFVVSGCGGVLGPKVSDTVKALVPVSCAINNANIDNNSYTQAASDALQGFPYDGDKADDLTVPANRKRIFTQRQAELAKAQTTVDGLKPEGAFEKSLVAAARQDLRALEPAIAFDLRYSPTDLNAPTAPDVPPNELSNAIEGSSAEVTKAFNACKLPADVARRQTAYGG
jgi:hypothetical protein